MLKHSCSMVSRIFGPSEDREDVTQAVEPFMLACEPDVVQWKARNFDSSNLILVMDPTLDNI